MRKRDKQRVDRRIQNSAKIATQRSVAVVFQGLSPEEQREVEKRAKQKK